MTNEYIAHLESRKIESNQYWTKQPIDGNGLNSFDGDFKFSDHSKVPALIVELVMELEKANTKFNRVNLEAVNEIANNVWKGPGSCADISDYIFDSRINKMKGLMSDDDDKK